MTKLTTESLEKFVNDIKTDGMCDITDSQVESALIRLFAYEQAAKNPVAWIVHMRTGDQFTTDSDFVGLGESTHGIHSTPLYLAPVLPKQPELIGMKVSIDTGSDNIDHRLFGEIVGTSDSNGVPVLCIEVTENNDAEPAPAQPVSEQPVSEPYKFLDERAKYRVIIEGFSNSRIVDFEACSQEEAEEIGRDIFHEECNYGVERLESIPAQESE
ncbi:hypothetical protein [Hafnia paralvei]|uniref:hypothetical protein n=1 Tax=Hafnia paralvei TaxID=546367 RepID=UPI0027BABF1F|nr:hypothetical protein [Hafnia paralvei]